VVTRADGVHMKGKILFVVGLGVGYVLGTRAGRERYEQIRKAAEGVWNSPAVQQGVGTVKDFAMTRVGDLSDTVLDGVKNLIGSATKTSGATKQDVSRAARTAKSNISKAADAARSAVDDAASKLEDAIDDAAEVASESATSGTSKPAAKRSPSSRGGGSATSGS
jgi:phage-related protein